MIIIISFVNGCGNSKEVDKTEAIQNSDSAQIMDKSNHNSMDDSKKALYEETIENNEEQKLQQDTKQIEGSDDINNILSEDTKDALEMETNIDLTKDEVTEIMVSEASENTDGETEVSETEDEDVPGSFAGELNAADIYSQLVVVESSGTRATVTMHENVDGIWREILRTAGYVGSMGVGQASEYKSVTPEGTFPLYFAFGVNPNPGAAVSYLQVDENDYWVGDSSSPLYNHYVRTGDPYTEWDDAEHLIDYPDAYAYCLFIGYNVEGTPEAGSCFFLHCSNGAPTAGCVSVPENDMIYILQNIGGNCGIVIY